MLGAARSGRQDHFPKNLLRIRHDCGDAGPHKSPDLSFIVIIIIITKSKCVFSFSLNLFCLVHFVFLFFTDYILTKILLFLLFSVSPCHLPQIYSSSISPKKRAGLLGISAEHCMVSYNKTRHIPSRYQSWMRQPIGGKQDPKAAKRVRDSSHFHF